MQAVFKASVAGMRTVPSRKVLQIIIEVPIEQQSHVASICEHGTWLGVARICGENGGTDSDVTSTREPHQSPSATPPDGGARSKYVSQAAMLCKKPSFWRFLEVYGAEEAANEVRRLCGVVSRSELLPGTQAWELWREIVTNFRAWQLEASVVG